MDTNIPPCSQNLFNGSHERTASIYWKRNEIRKQTTHMKYGYRTENDTRIAHIPKHSFISLLPSYTTILPATYPSHCYKHGTHTNTKTEEPKEITTTNAESVSTNHNH
jgi:hypothetical protein